MSDPDPAPGSSSVFNQFSLAGKAALITGASRGLGRVITLALADAGADVALVARDAERLEHVAAEVKTRGRRAVTIPADLVVMDELHRAVGVAYEVFEKIDVLVCNAGICVASRLCRMLSNCCGPGVTALVNGVLKTRLICPR